MIEEKIEGEEVSVLAFTDGYTVYLMPPAQDHKRIFNGDKVCIMCVVVLFCIYLLLLLLLLCGLPAYQCICLVFFD